MKTLKTLLVILIIFITISSSVHFVYANENKVIDQSQILTAQQEQTLTKQMNKIINQYQFDLVILIVNSTDGKDINTFADDYFDNNGYGIGSDYDGAIFVLDYPGREMAISTCGYGITAFTDYGIEYIFDELMSDMREADYYNAFKQYIKLSGKFLKEAKTNVPYDVSHEVPEPTNYPLAIAIGLLGGLVIAFIATHRMKSQLKSVKPLGSVEEYADQNGLALSTKQDIFLYSTLSKTKIPQETSSSRSSSPHKQSGGSRTHTSSSGRVHGGGSRKF